MSPRAGTTANSASEFAWPAITSAILSSFLSYCPRVWGHHLLGFPHINLHFRCCFLEHSIINRIDRRLKMKLENLLELWDQHSVKWMNVLYITYRSSFLFVSSCYSSTQKTKNKKSDSALKELISHFPLTFLILWGYFSLFSILFKN